MAQKKDYQNHNPIVGTNLKRLRKERDLKAMDVVAQLQTRSVDMTTIQYSHVENGRNNPSVDLLRALTDIFQCDYNEFFKDLSEE